MFLVSVGDEKEKGSIIVLLVGAPGSGKFTFIEHVMQSSSRSWAHIFQLDGSTKEVHEVVLDFLLRRLKPGGVGGDVNAAIFNDVGPALEVSPRDCAKSLLPGHVVAVPLT
ncbi:unnamed protein product [Linum tenue]|uniref:Uncharacterized protein n=1 Tax=Linum tenue TaxID=586396 RepID=A0AAV0Q311_9ROSI|nr:unnamed protein product [Linum tenue]